MVSAKNSRSFCSILAISCVLATMTSPGSTAAVAQNNDSGADSSATESAARKPVLRRSSVAAQTPAQATGSDKSSDASGDISTDDSSIAARRRFPLATPRRRRATTPLTTVEAFARTPLIQGGAWPNIGPFQPSKDNNSLVDKMNDSIKIEATDQKQITAVDLTLVGPAATDFLGVEMTSDFLLEALGTRPARISDFNVALEKAKTTIFVNSRAVTLTAGRYKVSFKLSSKDENGGRTLTIRMESPDIGIEGAEEKHSIISDFGDLASAFDKIKPVPGVDPLPPKESKPSEQSSEPVFKASKPGHPGDLKATFKELVQNWQKIKRNAVKNRDISELPQVLAGHALTVQTGGIKWLSSKHQYYEMVPMAVEVNSVNEIIKDKKYSVIATVKESSKLYDEQSNQLLREAEDTYHVNYTVEKQGDKYVISDSSIIKLGDADQSAASPPAKRP